MKCPLCGALWAPPAEPRVRPEGWLTVEEGAELLRAIFPDYPDVRRRNPVPDVPSFVQHFQHTRSAS